MGRVAIEVNSWDWGKDLDSGSDGELFKMNQLLFENNNAMVNF